MSLLTNAELKTAFPAYADYILDEGGEAQEDILTAELNNSDTELSQYIVLPETASALLKLHLVNIAKYRLFCRVHGDTAFDNKPQIVKNYETTIKALENVKSGGSLTGTAVTDTTDDTSIRINSTTPRSKGWFDPNTMPGNLLGQAYIDDMR